MSSSRPGRHVLIIGAGSVGKRHARNLAALGCRLSAFDLREDRRSEFAAEVPVVRTFERLDEALATEGLDAAAVCSPTAFHADQAVAALEARLPVLLEKPAAMTQEEARRIAEAAARTSTPVLLGYTWRWWPPLRRVRERLASGAIGAVRHVHCHMSAHLADWHPWERYQEFFMASQALGGGALLDESHWIDLTVWLFGMPLELSARVGRVSSLEIDSDDSVDVLCGYDRMRVSIHLDLYGRPHEKSIRFTGEEGTLLWSADPNLIRIGRTDAQVWDDETFTCERNDMFVGVACEFLDVCDGRPPATCTIQDGVDVMTVVDAIRKSSVTGSTVRLPVAAAT
jgi:predicted dehydrogenase